MTILVLAYAVAGLLLLGLLIRWEIRRHRRPPTYAELLARMTGQIQEVQRTIGEAFIPAMQVANAAFVAFGEALAELPIDEAQP